MPAICEPTGGCDGVQGGQQTPLTAKRGKAKCSHAACRSNPLQHKLKPQTGKSTRASRKLRVDFELHGCMSFLTIAVFFLCLEKAYMPFEALPPFRLECLAAISFGISSILSLRK